MIGNIIAQNVRTNNMASKWFVDGKETGMRKIVELAIKNYGLKYDFNNINEDAEACYILLLNGHKVEYKETDEGRSLTNKGESQ